MDLKLNKILGVLSSNISVVLIQGIQFIILARVLGANQFGEVAFANALVAILSPLAGIGMGNVLLMELSRDVTHQKHYAGNAIASTVVSGLFLAFIGMMVAYLFYADKRSMTLIIVLLINELVFLKNTVCLTQFFFSKHDSKRAAVTNVYAPIARLIATLLLLANVIPTTAIAWAITLTFFSVITFGLSVYQLHQSCIGLAVSLKLFKTKLRTGIAFALGTEAKAIYTDADKMILGKTVSSDILGAYASAYRLTVMAFMPIRAILDISAARFFKDGETGLKGSLGISSRLLRVSIPYGIISGIGIYVIADYIPFILGESYFLAPQVLHILFLLPVIQSIHYVLSDSLTGAGYQFIRTAIQFFVVCIYVVIGILVIPQYGWEGAAWTCIGSETLLAIMICLAVYFIKKKEVSRDDFNAHH